MWENCHDYEDYARTKQEREAFDCGECGSVMTPGGVNAPGLLQVIDDLRATIAARDIEITRLTRERDKAQHDAERRQRRLKAEWADTQRMDWLADTRICDGIAEMDIDEMTLAAVTGDTEEEWAAEWRVQFRRAIDIARTEGASR